MIYVFGKRLSLTATLLILTAALLAYMAPSALAASQSMTRIPVLAHNIAANEMVDESDLTWASVPSRQVRPDTVTEPEDIIGLAPRRAQSAGRALRRIEFTAPIAVRKGGYVTVMLRHGALLLTTQGRAMEQGAEGDVVRLQNLDSNQTLVGEIVAPGVVEVHIHGRTALLALN